MFDCSLALVFDGQDHSLLIQEAIQELNPKKIILEERTVLVISKDLKQMKEYPIPKKFIPFVKLIVIPQESAFGSNGRNPTMTFSVFIDKNDQPLEVEYSDVNLIGKYIVIDDCTDFNFLIIMAEKKERKVRVLVAEAMKCSFTIEGEDDEEIEVMDKDICVEFLCQSEPERVNINQFVTELARQAFQKKY